MSLSVSYKVLQNQKTLENDRSTYGISRLNQKSECWLYYRRKMSAVPMWQAAYIHPGSTKQNYISTRGQRSDYAAWKLL